MIKFTDDFSDLTVADLLVKKTMQTKLVRIRLGIQVEGSRLSF